MENRSINMQENWNKWNPCEMPEGIYYVTNFVQNQEGTKITLADEENCIEVFFDGVPQLVRTSIEGIRMRTWGEVQIKYNDKFFFRNWFLYKVGNSRLSDWASEESCGFYSAKDLTHYCIITSEDIIDVLATFEPTLNIYS